MEGIYINTQAVFMFVFVKLNKRNMVLGVDKDLMEAAFLSTVKDTCEYLKNHDCDMDGKEIENEMVYETCIRYEMLSRIRRIKLKITLENS